MLLTLKSSIGLTNFVFIFFLIGNLFGGQKGHDKGHDNPDNTN